MNDSAHSIARRDLLLLGAALSLAGGCAPTLPPLRGANLDDLEPDGDILLLGRIRLMMLDVDRTGDAFIRINAAADEVLLPPDGEVAWVVHRPRKQEVRLTRLSSMGHKLYFGLADMPVLAPRTLRAAINYFGTVKIVLDRAAGQNRDDAQMGHTGRLGLMRLNVVDEAARDMPAFVAQNPRLAGRVYCHVLRGAILEAPARAA